MMIRLPAVAGMFYPADGRACLRSVNECLEQAEVRASAAESTSTRAGEHPFSEPAAGRMIGGVVPHAGWICSGAVAARVIQHIARRVQPSTVVVFGAIHVPHGPRASLFPQGAWETPLGLAHVDDSLSATLTRETDLLDAAPQAHENEHSIEVEVPFVQHLLPEARIIPIMTPPNEAAAALGRAVGEICRSMTGAVVFLASTDLTHYGPGYGFSPRGVGDAGLQWARDVNDRRMIDLMLAMRDDQAVAEAKAHFNACGAGAIAATIAACKAYGANRAELLEHTTSHEVLREIRPERPIDAVGYAGLVFTD